MSTKDSRGTGGPGTLLAPADAEEAWGEPLGGAGETRYSQSLERGLAILGCFTRERPVLGIAALAELLGLSRSTTHRYVSTLVALGYLRQGQQRKYRLALRVTALGMATMNATSLREHARPYLEELSRRTSFTVAVSTLEGIEVSCTDIVRAIRGQRLLGAVVYGGARLPAQSTAMGKLLLAHLPARERRTRLGQLRLQRGGPGTVTSKRALRQELDAIPAAGLATSAEELAPELIAIAAPIRDESREVRAALGMAAPAAAIALEDLVEELGPHLISTAARISARLGYRRADER
jgi:IclR family pca regulon transcriptional regulator